MFKAELIAIFLKLLQKNEVEETLANAFQDSIILMTKLENKQRYC